MPGLGLSSLRCFHAFLMALSFRRYVSASSAGSGCPRCFWGSHGDLGFPSWLERLTHPPAHPLPRPSTQRATHPPTLPAHSQLLDCASQAGPNPDAGFDIGSTSAILPCPSLRNNSALRDTCPPCPPPGSAAARQSQSSQPPAWLPSSSKGTSRSSSGGYTGALKSCELTAARTGRT